MARPKRDPSALSREEDYRDYEAREIDEGWPYSDEDGEKKAANIGYGNSESNFDETEVPGAEISANTAIESSGGPSVFPEDEDAIIEDDAIGEQIALAYEANDLDGRDVTITVHKGIADLSGRVDSDADKAKLIRVALAVPGVKNVTDGIILSGVDTHIPSDVTE